MEYQGAVGANASEIMLRVPGGRGSAAFKWTQLNPKTLLAMSTAFIGANPAEAPDRQWLCAVFAHATGQAETARALSDAAAAAKPEYRAQLNLLK